VPPADLPRPPPPRPPPRAQPQGLLLSPSSGLIPLATFCSPRHLSLSVPRALSRPLAPAPAPGTCPGPRHLPRPLPPPPARSPASLLSSAKRRIEEAPWRGFSSGLALALVCATSASAGVSSRARPPSLPSPLLRAPRPEPRRPPKDPGSFLCRLPHLPPALKVAPWPLASRAHPRPCS